jgi:hypothetical protein
MGGRNMQALYIGISIAAFIAILVLLVLNRRKIHRISTLTMLGMTMVVLGIIFGDSRWISYSLIGVGVLLAVIDAKYVNSHGES